jgi:hypothetical protein
MDFWTFAASIAVAVSLGYWRGKRNERRRWLSARRIQL